MKNSENHYTMGLISNGLSLACMTVMSVLAFACSGSDGRRAREVFETDRPTADYEFDGHSRYSIKAYVSNEDGEYKLVELSPQNAAYAEQQFSSEQGSGAEGEQSEESVSRADDGAIEKKEQRIRGEVSDGGVYSDPILPPSTVAGWAYESCGNEWHASVRSAPGVAWPQKAGGWGAGVSPSGRAAEKPRTSASSDKWWNATFLGNLEYDTFYVASILATSRGGGEWSCDSVLAMQAMFLCTTEKLISIAESSSSTVFKVGNTDVYIPPQASEDRFLIRQVAFETLAAFAQVSKEGVGSSGGRCGSYLKDHSDGDQGSVPSSRWDEIVDPGGDVPFFGLSRPGADWPDATGSIEKRAELWLNHHQRAVELLNGLIEGFAVHAIGQAEALRVEGGTPLMWGIKEDSDEAELIETIPNSLRGAAAALLGRLETDDKTVNGPSTSTNHPDPACSGAVKLKDYPGELDIMAVQDVMLRARAADLPPKTLNQQRAQAVMERLGLVIHSEDAATANLKTIVKEQLAIADAFNEGLGATVTELSQSTSGALSPLDRMLTERGDAYDALLRDLTEQDFTFALATNLSLYHLLNGGRETRFPSQSYEAGAGLYDLDSVLSGPTLTATNSTSRRAIISTSATKLSGFSRSLITGDAFTQFAAASAASQCPSIYDPLQDVASLAEALYSSAMSLESSDERLYGPALQRFKAEYFATHAVRGLTSALVRHNDGYGVSGGWQVTLEGDHQLAGVDSLGDLPVALVYGVQWQAECVAGVRSLCESGSINKFTRKVELYDMPGSWAAIYEPSGFTVPISIIPDGAKIAPGASLLYVVLEPTATNPGRVLSAFRPSITVRRAAFSQLQRNQLTRLFEVSSRSHSGDRCLEGTSTAQTSATCVDGIRSNQYVPLANELTSSSDGTVEDSWKHYLSLAKEASTHADELGRQIIELGTARDLRAESASEELAGICGGVPDDLVLEDGSVFSTKSSEFNECIAPSTHEIVFFQGDTASIKASIDEYQQIVNEHQACGSGCTDIQGLGMDPPPAAYRPPGIPGCDALLGEEGKNGTLLDNSPLVRFIKDGEEPDPTWFRESTQKDHYSFSSLASAATKYQFVESPDGFWAVYLNGLEPVFAGHHGNQSSTIELDNMDSFYAGPYSGFPLCERVSVAPEGGDDPHPGLGVGDGCSSLALRAAAALGYDSHFVVAATQFDANRHEPENKHVAHSLPSGTWAELETRLRPIMEGGLWHMVRLTGNMPRGVFTLVVPAYNFAEDETDRFMEWPALYSLARYSEVGATGEYRLDENAQVFGTDLRSMPILKPQSTWQRQYKVARGQLSPHLPRREYYETANAGTAEFLVTGPVSNDSKLFDGMKNYNQDSQFQEVHLEQWLLDVTQGNEATRAQAFDATVQALNWGVAPQGVDLLQDGILKSLVVRREAGCRVGEVRGRGGVDKGNRELIYGKVGKLVPYDGDYVASDAVLWPTHLDQNDGSNVGPFEPSWLEADGWVQADALSDNFTSHGSCSGSGGNITCSPGNGSWPGAKSEYLQYNSCREQQFEYALPLVSATVWPAPQRVHMYVDPGPDAMSAVAAMGILSCLADGSSAGTSLEVPVINDPRQIPSLRQWIETQSEILAENQKRLFLTNVPKEVVGYFKGEGLHGSVGGGQTSDQMLALAQAFEAIHAGFSAVYSGVRAMGDAVRSAEHGITGAEIQGDIARSQLAVARANAIASLVSSTIAAAKSTALAVVGFATQDYASGAAAAADSASAISSAVAAGVTLSEAGKQGGLNESQRSNSIDMVIQGMTEGVQRGLEQADQGMTQTQTGLLEALRVQNALKGLQDKAIYQAAKASGADGIDLDGNGSIDKQLPVNVVYRRQFDILKRRYETALESAKRYSYLARLSIEQRLGVRMASLDEDIGPLPPPSQWAEKVCSATGVDYATLRSLSPTDIVADSHIDENSVLDDFVDQFVGDYVRQLEEFVEYYNIEYPFHEDDDAAVLSLRDDLVYGNGGCRREAKNLLFFSDALGHRNVTAETIEAPERNLEGWAKSRCATEVTTEELEPGQTTPVIVGSCLEVSDQVQQLEGDQVGVPFVMDDGAQSTSGMLVAPPLASGLTLITPRPMGSESLLEVELEEAMQQHELNRGSSVLPKNAIYQTVFMEKGAFYRLSWLDQSRDGFGAETSSPTRYRVTVTDESGTPIFLQDLNASTDDEWSERHSYEVYSTADGFYHVMFVPLFERTIDSEGNETTNESLALSSVQLEYFEANGPADYEATTGTRMISVNDCGAGNGELFRQAFVRICYQGECYYELTKPIQLTDNDIDGGRWDLPGIAEQNYNYRHRTLALNVVGTGVLDCDGANPGCFSNGFVEYDLVHTAHNTALRDYGGEPRCFNFGQGEIKHAKALTAERYLGIPMSSDDKSLIGGADFTKGAFHGRPLTGMYTLRIHESPQMRWENVEDIQLLLNYRYWSRVKRNPN